MTSSSIGTAITSSRGKRIARPAYDVEGVKLVVHGGALRVASIFDEEWQQTELITDPVAFADSMKAAGVDADILRFAQKLPHTEPEFPLPFEWINLAVVDCTDYRKWWSDLATAQRTVLRKPEKLGVVIEERAFDDDFARGVKGIYDETPVRQGRKFWHYGKPLEAVKQENVSYLDRSIIIGASFEGELIGYLKIVRVGSGAHVMQILAKNAHARKKTTNGLLAKGIEVCHARGAAYLVYGAYSYGPHTSVQLTDFKRRHGFQQVLVPQYHVPLNAKGRLAVRTGLHLGYKHFLPDWLDRNLRDARAAYYNWRYPTAGSQKPSGE